jgi:hypothetical protein
MMQRPVAPRTHSPARRGSALILVLVMTLSLAGLAVSAILLTSSSSLVQRYYDKEKDFRLYAQAAVARVKSAVQRDTTLAIPGDTAYRALTAATIADAAGGTNTTIRVNGYAAYTADTGGTYIPFLTIVAQAYDTLGVRSVQRLDLQSESFSRYAIFVDTFLPNTALGSGLYIRGRVHGNRNWNSAASPGTYYYDTVSVSGSAVSGTSTYTSPTAAVTSAPRIKWPTSTSLAALPTLAAAGNLSFAQVASSNSPAYSGGRYISGDATNSSASARRGTRVRFRPVDVNNNGTYDAAEGFIQVFDLATGMDTSNLRADLTSANNETSRPTDCDGSTFGCRSAVILNNCGLMVKIPTIGAVPAHNEFFPAARFREAWVLQRVMLSTAPVILAADTSTLGHNYTDALGLPEMDSVATKKILSYGVGYSRCFPSGSPYLMLTERYHTAASCTTVDSTVNAYPYAWGGPGACTAQRYGGQDTTFTVNVRRCYIVGISGQCYDESLGGGWGNGLQRLGAWRAFGGTSTASPPASVLQAVEIPYLWPLSTTYNAASRGVIYASGLTSIHVSDTLRGYATLYAHGRIVLIDDLVYDKDPLDPTALCRNMLGIISDTNIKVANSPINFPRRDPSNLATYRFLGTPNFNLHAIALALSTNTLTTSNTNIRSHGTIAVEDSTSNGVGGLTCNGVSTSGGCWYHTGAAIMKVYHQSTGAAGTGLLRSITRDPCQAQQANRRPPFFPLTGRYVDYKASEVDPRTTSTWAMIKTYYSRLRGNNRPVP